MRVDTNMMNNNFADRSHSMAIHAVLNKNLIKSAAKDAVTPTSEESMPKKKIKPKMSLLEKRLFMAKKMAMRRVKEKHAGFARE